MLCASSALHLRMGGSAVQCAEVLQGPEYRYIYLIRSKLQSCESSFGWMAPLQALGWIIQSFPQQINLYLSSTCRGWRDIPLGALQPCMHLSRLETIHPIKAGTVMLPAALRMAAMLVLAQALAWLPTAAQGLTRNANKELAFLTVGNLTASDNNNLFIESQAPDLCASAQSSRPSAPCRHSASVLSCRRAGATSGPRYGASRSRTRPCAVSRTTWWASADTRLRAAQCRRSQSSARPTPMPPHTWAA